MERFELLLKNEKLHSYQRIGYWVSVINVIFFVFFALFFKQGYERILWLLFSMIIPVLYYAGKIISRKNISFIYCFLIILWIGISFWIALLHVVLLVLDILAKRKLKIVFYSNGIEYPSFPKRTIQWSELDNVILKDGLMTIDFKNNHLLQSEIDTSKNEIDETAFNRFSQQQLKTAIIET